MSVDELIASPIWPRSPPTRPAPKSMNTAIPFAVEERNTEPSRLSAATITTATASPSAGCQNRSGHQPPAQYVIPAVAENTPTT